MPEFSRYVVRAGHGTFADAWTDLRWGLQRAPVWRELVRRDLASRTKGANLGTLWLIIAQAVAIMGMGVVYSSLFNMNLQDYLPYLATGLITWGLMISLINEGSDVFTYSRGYLTQIRLPLSVFVLRYVVRNLIIYLYRATIIVAVLAYFLIVPALNFPLFIVGIAAILLCGFFFGFAIGMVSARYRDVGQLINSASVFLFFITPVFWKSDRLGAYRWVADYNPLYHFLSLVRNPLLGQPVSGWSFLMVGLTIAVVFAVWLVVYRKIGRELVYSL